MGRRVKARLVCTQYFEEKLNPQSDTPTQAYIGSGCFKLKGA